VSGLAVVTALAISSLPAHADAPSPSNSAGGELGIVLPHDQASHTAGSGGNLIYHTGGSVQTGNHTTYAIYWSPFKSTFGSGYQSVIDGYFSNVAAASGATSNVYYSDTQYYQTVGGTTTPITYSESAGNSATDTSSPTASGCSSTAGGALGCISDAQIQAEVQKVAATLGGAGLNKEYFVFLGKGVSTCYSSSSCFVSQFCAYHSHVGSGSSTYLYANMPYTGFSPAACGSGVSPNNNPDADSTINVTSHEANETITDALGNAWYDRRGYENGDKCAWNFGPGGSYNQTINLTHYYLQQEWSNYSSGCVLTGK
ncbi:MAG TPA: hypothetical protein VIO57_09365, partial [Chloroflexota bacterium]